MSSGCCYASTIPIFVMSLFATGCGLSDQVATGTVQGNVTLDGRPFTQGRVICVPAGGATGATGEIRSDGTFVLYREKPGDGVAAGKYKLGVVAYESNQESDREPELMRKLISPPRYADPGRSGFTVEVVAGKESQVLLEMKSD